MDCINQLNLKNINPKVEQMNLNSLEKKDISESNTEQKYINICFTKESDTFFPKFYRYEGKGILLYYRIIAEDDTKNRIGSEIVYNQEFPATLQVLFKTYDYKNKVIFLEIPILCKMKEIPNMVTLNIVDIRIDMMPILRFYDRTPFSVKEYESLEELDNEIMNEYKVKNKKHPLEDLDSNACYRIAYNYEFNSEYEESEASNQIRFLNNSTSIKDLYMK